MEDRTSGRPSRCKPGHLGLCIRLWVYKEVKAHSLGSSTLLNGAHFMWEQRLGEEQLVNVGVSRACALLHETSQERSAQQLCSVPALLSPSDLSKRPQSRGISKGCLTLHSCSPETLVVMSLVYSMQRTWAGPPLALR